MAWLAPAQVLRRRTHCANGHEYTPENTYRKDGGWRECRQCRRDYMRRYMRTYSARKQAENDA
jgi:hypothetical protein